ncbi:hypothetical protein MKW92_048812 [Papaver armeniacum]|nr:hypothetical protein MKW92_048812 [Papaver armeniacum]
MTNPCKILAQSMVDYAIPSGFDQLTNLEYLNLSYSGEFGQIQLRYLMTSGSYLTDPDLGTLIRNLTQLRELLLDGVFLSGQATKWCHTISSFLPKLEVLSLCECGISGPFDSSLLKLRSLSVLQLDDNKMLAEVPKFFSKFHNLTTLHLAYCELYGKFPERIFQLPMLQRIDLSWNDRLQGSLPEFPKDGLLDELTFPTTVSLVQSQIEWKKFRKLVTLELANNLLNGTIPTGILTLPSVPYLDLSMNQFGQFDEFSTKHLSKLKTLDLSNNQLQGLIPKSIFEMPSLTALVLSSNNFSGITTSNSVSNLRTLLLSGNQFTEIPIFLKYQSKLQDLDLSNNQIHGKIPNWIWKIGNAGLDILNLSRNFLEDPEQPWPVNSFESLDILDLRSNWLQGNNPILPPSAGILDYSFNNFTAMIPNISSHLSNIEFLYFSNNQLNGDISMWVCGIGTPNLRLLDLSYNNFSGRIPSCLVSSPSDLQVLNLKGNNFQGNIPEKLFPQFCVLNTVDLSNNRLQGRLPRSIVNCTGLEVLNVGNNRLTGTFPSWLGTQCNFSMLQIIDISSNKFSGILPKDCLSRWKAMIINKKEREWNQGNQILQYNGKTGDMYYQPKVTITSKGVEVELVKILTIFTSIDLSNNRFEGGIPEIFGSLTALCNLNFSNNAFTGKIPSTFGNLTHLESLDLSRNKLTGKIPFQLAGLSSLSVLNLSFNKLVGEIPSGSQFQTFDSSSFQGNIGLCGFPLSEDCNKTVQSLPNAKDENAPGSKDEFDWVLFAVTFLGFVLGAGMVIGPQYFWKKGRKWANKCINKILRIH